MQVRHPYEYSEYSGSKHDWRKQGKKLSRDWVYVWALKNPKTGKIALVMSDCESGAPTRVEPIETWYNRDRLRALDGTDEREHELDDGEKWRIFCAMVDQKRIGMTEKNHGVVDSAYLESILEREYLNHE
ncbi:hypothetical protein [uncultured Sphingomonas sp.]|uniref:hypothetical protein n=1 Tax=uncultured Sphingomonas sp. TaxID=158754 RepID=UPI0025965B16|nr:hypothetical protein [uncultured Sphingomonas sp.]